MLILSILALLIVTSTGCSKKGEAEKAGEKVDQTINAAKDKFNEATK
jgi:hypothetical protein